MLCHNCSAVSGQHRWAAGTGIHGPYSSGGYLWSNQQLLVYSTLFWLYSGKGNTPENTVVATKNTRLA